MIAKIITVVLSIFTLCFHVLSNRATSWSFYDDVVTSGTDKDITAIRLDMTRSNILFT